MEKCFQKMEAAPGFEPGIGVLQTPALPLGYAAANNSIIYLQKVNILNVAQNRDSASFLPPNMRTIALIHNDLKNY